MKKPDIVQADERAAAPGSPSVTSERQRWQDAEKQMKRGRLRREINANKTHLAIGGKKRGTEDKKASWMCPTDEEIFIFCSPHPSFPAAVRVRIHFSQALIFAEPSYILWARKPALLHPWSREGCTCFLERGDERLNVFYCCFFKADVKRKKENLRRSVLISR